MSRFLKRIKEEEKRGRRKRKRKEIVVERKKENGDGGEGREEQRQNAGKRFGTISFLHATGNVRFWFSTLVQRCSNGVGCAYSEGGCEVLHLFFPSNKKREKKTVVCVVSVCACA